MISGFLFGQLAPFRGFFSGNQVHFGQVDPFRGFFGQVGAFRVFFGRLGPFRFFVRAIGPFRCWGDGVNFVFLVPLRFFVVRARFAAFWGMFRAVGLNLGSLLDHARTIPFNPLSLPQLFLPNPKHKDHGRLRPPSPGLPLSAFLVLAMVFHFVFANFGSGPREWLLSHWCLPNPPLVCWASVSASLPGLPSPPQ